MKAIPSLSMATVAAWLEPGRGLTATWEDDKKTFNYFAYCFKKNRDSFHKFYDELWTPSMYLRKPVLAFPLSFSKLSTILIDSFKLNPKTLN